MERISPKRLRDFLRLLPAFLDGLRAQEFKVGTRQHIAVQELVGEMVARDFVPDSFADFGDWLAPLLCTSRQEQEEFHNQFQRWLLDNDFAKEEEVAPHDEDGRRAVTHAEAEGARVTLKVDTPPPPPTIRERARRLLRTIADPRRLRRVSAAGALLLGLTLVGWAAYSVNRARLAADALTLDTLDPELSRKIAAFYTPVSTPSPAPLPTPDDQQKPGGTVDPPPPPPTPTPMPKIGYAYDLTKPRESPTERPDLAEVKPDMTPPPETFPHRAFPVVLVAAPALPLLWFGAWLYRLRKRRAEQAARWQPGKRPHLDKIKVKGPRERVFGGSWLRQAARELRRHRRVASVQLDARATVHATARRTGLFTPSYGLRRTLPEYLVLIDRVGFTDQLAQLNSDVVRRLVENDVYVDAYYFVGDPLRCHNWREETTPASLQDLAAHYPDHRLIVFSEGEGLINPQTGRPQRSVGQFAFWEQRALLTTVPSAQWGEREKALLKSGLAVLPADADGLRALADAVNIGAQPRVPDAAPAPPYPSILRERRDLWKERAAPPAHQSARLLSQLRRYLGPGGYELLCACAVYPLLQWGVTVYLAAELLEPAEAERAVRALVRLPWFRHGMMPEWLRVQLIEEPPAERRRLVRERLELLLLNFIEDPLKGLRLSPVGGSTTRRAAGLFESLAVRRRRRRLRRLIEHAPPRSPVSDPVFVNFLTSNRLVLLLPERLRRFLFRRGVVAYGLRPAPALAATLVVSLAALSLLLLARPDDDLSARGWPDITCPLFCPRESGKTPASEPYDFAYTPTFGARGQSINLDVYAVKDDAHDFGQMRIRPKDDAASGLLVKLRRATTRRLYKQITVAPDAPLGETTLFLYDGDHFRASLPFTITTAAPTPSPSPTPGRCPTIVINVVGSGGDEFPTGDDLFYADLINIPPGIGSLTYNWRTTGEVSIRSGQGTSPVRIVVDDPIPAAGRKQAVSVTVGGLPVGCPNTATYTFSLGGAAMPTPTSAFSVSVEPQSITVCPSNPQLNNPPRSKVRVSLASVPFFDNVGFLASVSGGKISEQGAGRAERARYDWDLSGVPPGAYTVTVYQYRSDQKTPTTADGSVTVNGCPPGPDTVIVRLVNKTGEPKLDLRKIKVLLIRAKQYSSPSSPTYKVGSPAADGSVVFTNLPPEGFVCVVQSQEYEGVAGEVAPGDTATNPVDLPVRKRAGGPVNSNSRRVPPPRRRSGNVNSNN